MSTHTSLFTTANGKTIHYQWMNAQNVSPTKPLLIFLHEGLGSIRQWKDFPALLCEATGLGGLAYDRYGYGLSSALSEERDSHYIENGGLNELPALLDALEINQPVILVGHSDGGSVALVFAGAYPERVVGVITEAAHLFLEQMSVAGIAKTEAVFKEGRLKELLSRYHGERTERMFYGWAATWQNPSFRNWNIEKYLKGITAPTLAIQGVDDEYGTEKQVDAVVAGVSGHVEKWMVPACGHIPHFQQKEQVLQRMSTFINQFCNQ